MARPGMAAPLDLVLGPTSGWPRATRGAHPYSDNRTGTKNRRRWGERAVCRTPDGTEVRQEAEYKEARPREHEPTLDFRWVYNPAIFFDPGPPHPLAPTAHRRSGHGSRPLPPSVPRPPVPPSLWGAPHGPAASPSLSLCPTMLRRLRPAGPPERLGRPPCPVGAGRSGGVRRELLPLCAHESRVGRHPRWAVPLPLRILRSGN